jgi:hypothetical protein
VRRHLRSDSQIPRPEADSVWALVRKAALFATIYVGIQFVYAAFAEKPVEPGLWIGIGVAVGFFASVTEWRVRPAWRTTKRRAIDAR